MTFVVTVRRVSPSLEKMINFCYLHYCPEGSSIGLTHLSFPLHCFSNGNGIEGTASWVHLAETLLSRGGAGEKKKTVFAHNKTAVSTWRCGSHTVQSLLGSSKQQNNLEGYEVLRALHSHCFCLIRALIGWAQSINQP